MNVLIPAYITFLEPTFEQEEQFLRETIRTGQSTLLLAMNANDEIVGFAQMHPMRCSLMIGNTGNLSHFYVPELPQKQNVAEALLKAMEASAKASNYIRIDIFDCVAMRDCFEKCNIIIIRF